MNRRPLLLVGAAFVALVALACSGDGEAEPLTPEQAAAVVQAGLLAQEDLPESSWQVTEDPAAGEDDEGAADEPDEMFSGVEECRDLEAAMQEFEAAEDAGTPALAEGERTFDSGGDSLVLQSVVSSVTVPADPADVDAGFEVLREVFDAEALQPCFEAAFNQSFSEGGETEGVSISELSVTEPETVADDGIGIAMDVQAIALIIPINMHMEIHMWPEGPAVGMLMLMELNSETIEEQSGDILAKAQTRLAGAVEANQ